MGVVLFFRYGGEAVLLDILACYTPQVEPCGDEVLADLKPNVLGELSAKMAAAGFKGPIGAGANPLIAKAALLAGEGSSRGAGRRGVLVRRQLVSGLLFQVPSGSEAQFMAGLPVDFLWPLSVKTIKLLRGLGLITTGDVARIPERELFSRFGTEGMLAAAYSRGWDHRKVRSLYPPPDVIWTLDLEHVERRDELERSLGLAAEQIVDTLRRDRCGYRHLELALRLESGVLVEGTRGFTEGAPDPLRMRFQLGMLLSLLAVSAPATGMRVQAGKLYRLQGRQMDFFTVSRAGEDALLQTLGAVNLKYPGKLVRGFADAGGLFRRERMRELYTGS
ncbi:MAG: hypothetical protein U1D96_11705 [Eubacteriales bacterium]|nr:hypothetical protein [Eubacteriales bacterium]MDQ7790119.1 hypothetical protein [Clostridia bacterium]MDZ4044126.1 hypothetical protein [Eubacteriales bacterium]MDZ7610953.1 hypothetical protein [Eubacteriales bacterium]